MLDMLLTGQLDIAFVLGGRPEIYEAEYIPLSAENLLLGVQRSHPVAQLAGPADQQPCNIIDLSLLKDEAFATALKSSTMRTELIDPIFEREQFHPRIMMESSFNSFLQQLAALGVCVSIVPQSRVTNHRDIAWFYLPGYPRFQFGVAYPKNYRLNRALNDFIELARQDAQTYLQCPPPEI